MHGVGGQTRDRRGRRVPEPDDPAVVDEEHALAEVREHACRLVALAAQEPPGGDDGRQEVDEQEQAGERDEAADQDAIAQTRARAPDPSRGDEREQRDRAIRVAETRRGNVVLRPGERQCLRTVAPKDEALSGRQRGDCGKACEQRAVERDDSEDTADPTPADDDFDRPARRRPRDGTERSPTAGGKGDTGQADRDPAELRAVVSEQCELDIPTCRHRGCTGAGRVEHVLVGLNGGP